MVKDVTRSKVITSFASATPAPTPTRDDGSISWQEFVDQALPTLETEMEFWKSKRNVESCGNLSQYFSSSSTPRPESYLEDVTTAAGSIRHDIYAQVNKVHIYYLTPPHLEKNSCFASSSLFLRFTILLFMCVVFFTTSCVRGLKLDGISQPDGYYLR
jgi:hypothetical protein